MVLSPSPGYPRATETRPSATIPGLCSELPRGSDLSFFDWTAGKRAESVILRKAEESVVFSLRGRKSVFPLSYVSIFDRFCVCDCRDFFESLHLHSRKSLSSNRTTVFVEPHKKLLHRSTREHRRVHGLYDIADPANRRFVTVIPELVQGSQSDRTRDASRDASASGTTAAAAVQEPTDPAQATCGVRSVCGIVPARPLLRSLPRPAVEFLVDEADTSQAHQRPVKRPTIHHTPPQHHHVTTRTSPDNDAQTSTARRQTHPQNIPHASYTHPTHDQHKKPTNHPHNNLANNLWFLSRVASAVRQRGCM